MNDQSVNQSRSSAPSVVNALMRILGWARAYSIARSALHALKGHNARMETVLAAATRVYTRIGLEMCRMPSTAGANVRLLEGQISGVQ